MQKSLFRNLLQNIKGQKPHFKTNVVLYFVDYYTHFVNLLIIFAFMSLIFTYHYYTSKQFL